MFVAIKSSISCWSLPGSNCEASIGSAGDAGDCCGSNISAATGESGSGCSGGLPGGVVVVSIAEVVVGTRFPGGGLGGGGVTSILVVSFNVFFLTAVDVDGELRLVTSVTTEVGF